MHKIFKKLRSEELWKTYISNLELDHVWENTVNNRQFDVFLLFEEF